MSQLHPNSHRITIFRTGSFLSRAQSKETNEYFAQTKESVGSYFESTSSSKVGNGLNFEEEKFLLPDAIDTEANDREFKKKVSEFYADLTTHVPFNVGVTLEVGLEKSNDKPVDKDNMPIALNDYLRYRHAKNHPQVAPTKELSQGNSLKRFYIFDPENVQAGNTKKNKEKDAAYAIYLKIKEEPASVDTMLTLLGIDPRNYIGKKEAEDLKKEKLRELAEAKPGDFVTTHEEGELEIRSWIVSMVNTKVLNKIGQRFMDTETNEVLANSLEEMIYFFKDESKSGEITVLKARRQEAMSKPMPKEMRKTQV